MLTLNGSITAGPSTGGSFPTSTFNDVISFPNGTSRSYGAASGMLTRSVNSPSIFAALGGIGTTGDVAAADFLYLSTDGQFDVQIVAQDGNGGSTTVVISLGAGPLILPVAANKLILSVGVKGSGTIQYFASGPA